MGPSTRERVEGRELRLVPRVLPRSRRRGGSNENVEQWNGVSRRPSKNCSNDVLKQCDGLSRRERLLLLPPALGFCEVDGATIVVHTGPPRARIEASRAARSALVGETHSASHSSIGGHFKILELSGVCGDEVKHERDKAKHLDNDDGHRAANPEVSGVYPGTVDHVDIADSRPLDNERAISVRACGVCERV